MQANILIVDDTLPNLQLLMEMLKSSGYKVRPASNGAFALKSIHSVLPDLILLDLLMPGMDGFKFCERLKAHERTRDIPVIFLTSVNSVMDKTSAFQLGCVDYITKPFQVEEVLARVKTHLTLRNQQQQLQQEIQRRTEAGNHLSELNDKLQAANADKDKFFSIIGHDLRAPFTVLIGLTELLAEDFTQYDEEKLRGMLQRLHSSSKQVYTLLTNLLDWARLQRGLLIPEPEAIPFKKIIERNIDLLAHAAQQKGLTIRSSVSEPVCVYADVKMTDTIFRNIFSNAIKFTGSGGTIDVSIIQQDQNAITATVTDTGIGIPPDVLEKLFRIDAKCSRPGTADEEGTGLGLILCNELIKSNNGALHVESEEGKGSRFLITLPTT